MLPEGRDQLGVGLPSGQGLIGKFVNSSQKDTEFACHSLTSSKQECPSPFSVRRVEHVAQLFPKETSGSLP